MLNLVRRSFRARLIFGALVWITAGVAISGFALAGLFRDQVTQLFDGELDGHADELGALVGVDAQGLPVLQRDLVDPRFEPSGSGWYWQVDYQGRTAIRSSSLGAASLQLLSDAPINNGHLRATVGPTGSLLLLERRVPVKGLPEPVMIGIGADQRVLDAALAGFNMRLGLSLAIVAAGLVAAAFAQVTFGLRPLRRLRASLAAVRSGDAERLPLDLPSEVIPLVTDLNALLQANQTMVSRARAQAGNLAHGLKTPLAILMDEGSKLLANGHKEAGTLVVQECDRMRRQIDYQLAQARAAALQAGGGLAVRVGDVIGSVLSALARLHRERGLRFEAVGDLDARVACDAEDLSEMVANLVDNAAKWARSTVRVQVVLRSDRRLRIKIEDDGPGMPLEARERVFKSGERLDEQAPGSGLGLAIVRDLANLYGGRAWIRESKLGGAAACLELPLAKSASANEATRESPPSALAHGAAEG